MADDQPCSVEDHLERVAVDVGMDDEVVPMNRDADDDVAGG